MTTEAPGRQLNVESVFELPGKSARTVLKYWKLFAFVNLPALLLAIPGFFGDDFLHPYQVSPGLNGAGNDDLFKFAGFSLLFLVIFLLISMFFYAMTVRLSLDAANNSRSDVKSLVDMGVKFWLRILALSIVMGIIIVAGLILLIIPGIIAAILLIFAPYVLVDRNTSIGEALKSSYRIVSANTGKVLGALLMFILLMIGAGIIMEIPYIGPLLGTIISILFSLILVFRYQELKNTNTV